VEPKELPLLLAPGRAAAGADPKDARAELNRLLRGRHAELLARSRARAADYLLATSKQPAGNDLHPALLGRWRARLEEAGKAHDPVLAPWLRFAALPAATFARGAPAVAAAVAANRDAAAPVNAAVARAFRGSPPRSLADVAGRYRKLFAAVEQQWQALLKARKGPDPGGLPNRALEEVRQLLHGERSPANVPPAEVENYLDGPTRDQVIALRRRAGELKGAPAAAPRAMALVDGPSPHDAHVLVRGSPTNHGPVVPRQFLEVLAGKKRKPFRLGSGRLELARAITDPNNPLTARVMVNRLWQHHFGAGLVRTPNDFGLRGEPPTHPELLDYLAWAFVRNGWSVKRLHRLILLSAAYRQRSEESPQGVALDPENRLLGRMNRRRLEFEPLRDALLAVAGRLDRHPGGPAVDLTKAPFPARRTVYGFIDRQALPGVFRAFDLANPDTSTGERFTTTVPQQALFLMNGPFVLEQARALAARPDVARQQSDVARVQRMHALAYGRPADDEEVALGLAFVREAAREPTAQGAEKLSAWEQYAQVLLLANEFMFVD
jgi:hypothetical protein